MDYTHFIADMDTENHSLPDLEERLRSVQNDLREIGGVIARQKSYAIRNTILSAILAVGGIIGAYKALNSGEDKEKMFHVSSAIGVIGLLGALYDGRKVISPGSFDAKTRLWVLQDEQELLLNLCSEIRHNNISS